MQILILIVILFIIFWFCSLTGLWWLVIPLMIYFGWKEFNKPDNVSNSDQQDDKDS